MKVLFYASNPTGSNTLRLEHEVTELQRASLSTGRRIDFIFLPALPFEDIGEQIANYRPDVVHISAHGEDETLILADADEVAVKLTVEALRALLAIYPPKLLYINACKSQNLASAIVDTVPFAIGTSEPITNFAARKGAVNFYRSILQGRNIAEAHRASNSTIETLSEGKVKAMLCNMALHDASKTFLYEPTQLVAHFGDHKFGGNRDGAYNFCLGVAGCPSSTIQVVFCTDDETFLGEDEDDLEGCLCSVERTTPVNGEIWLEDVWQLIYGDFRVYALGTTASGGSFSLGCTICEALEVFYKVYFETADGSLFPKDLKDALFTLRQNDGSKLRPMRTVVGQKRGPAKAGDIIKV